MRELLPLRFLQKKTVPHVLHARPSYTSQFIHCLLHYFGATAPSGPGAPPSRGFYIIHNEAPQSVGLLWTSDRPVAETST